MIDTGASFHITPSRECFSSYTAGDYGYVKIGDNGECRIVSIGSGCLITPTGCGLTLRNVRQIRLNLISIGRLDDEGDRGNFQIGM